MQIETRTFSVDVEMRLSHAGRLAYIDHPVLLHSFGTCSQVNIFGDGVPAIVQGSCNSLKEHVVKLYG